MIVTIDGIPVYQATVSDEDTGMMKISLVDDPAVQTDFLKFSGTKKRQLYAIQDEDKRLVRGVVMRADFPIYRRDDSVGEYYIIYKADTIRKMAEKYLVENRQNDVNLMHREGSDVDGVQMVQWFLKESAAGISPEGFDDIADGSLFAEFHVVNDDVWAEIKAGTYKGFSLEGYFDLVPETDVDEVEDIVRELAGQFRQLFKNYDMGKLQRFKASLLRALAEFGNTTTDKGVVEWDGDEDLKAGDRLYTIDENGNRTAAPDGDYTTSDGKVIRVADGAVAEILDPAAEVEDEFGSKETDRGSLEWDGEEDLKAGDAVFVRDENGERVAAPDGDYVTEDGKTIRVADGVVTEILDPAAEVAPEEMKAARKQRFDRVRALFEESYEDKMKKIYEAIVAAGYNAYGYVCEAGDDFAIFAYYDEVTWEEHLIRFDVAWNEAGEPTISNPQEGRWGFVPEAKEDDAPAAVVEDLKKQNAELQKQIAELKRKPLAKAAHEEVKTTTRFQKTGVKGLDRLAEIMSAE